MPPAFRRLVVALCATFAIPANNAFAEKGGPPVAAGADADAAQFKGAAEALLPAYTAATSSTDLTRLYRLQLAAGRYATAEDTLAKLQALYRRTEPSRADGLIPWRTYTRAQRYAQDGMAFPSAFGRAFAESYGDLSNRRMADVLPWWHADLDELHRAYDEAAKACLGVALAVCPSGAEVVSTREALAAWEVLMSTSPLLIRADAERRFHIDDQLLIPTPDGAQIDALLVRPRSTERPKRVALLNFTIYANDRWSFADAVKMAAYGYAGVVAYTRGKGRSPGPVTPYEHDGADAATVIEWLARQPWSDGRVGMFSGSYNASTQWAAVKHRPAALKAIATNASNAPGVDTPMQGNVFQSFIYPWLFYTTDTKGLDDKTYGDTARWDRLERMWYASGRPYRDLDKIDGKPNPVFDTWLNHPDYDAYWRRLIPYGREFAGVDIPVFVETGYYDGGMVGALHYLEQHYRYRPSADHRLLVGPYHHTAMQTGVLPVVDGYAIDPAARIDLQDIRLKWFDHVFYGSPLPEVLKDRINFEVMGANRWRHVATLSQMANHRLRLHLTTRRDGDRLLFSPAAPASDAPGPELDVNLADRSDADYQPSTDRPDTRNALVYTTAPLARATEVDGLFHGRFAVEINKRDFDLAISFYEQRADGRYLSLASYLGRASYMADRTHRRLLVPGRRTTLTFQSQTLTARLLSPGSRIVAVVGVPKRPDMQINYGTGKDVSDESITDVKTPLRICWLKGSYIELPIM